jgi:hypothetical protein
MSKKTFKNYLSSIREFESGIFLEKFNWYIENYNKPIIKYPRTTAVGQVAREDETGKVIYDTLTVKEYFSTLGVNEYFDFSCSNCLNTMQYKVINPWGFIGYQIGEAILISTGYYKPKLVGIDDQSELFEKYYLYLSNDLIWRNGNKETIYTIPNTQKKIIVTDVNRWEGSFTGKNGVNSVDDLMDCNKQDIIFVDILRYNYIILEYEFLKRDIKIIDLINKSKVFYTNFDKDELKINLTLSGILSTAHFSGAYGVLNLLIDGKSNLDEFGTSSIKYLEKFSGYEMNLYD